MLNYILLHLNENCGRNLARIYLTRYLNRSVLNAYFWFCWRKILVENRKHRQCFQLCQINSNFSLCKICWFLKELGLSINIYESFFLKFENTIPSRENRVSFNKKNHKNVSISCPNNIDRISIAWSERSISILYSFLRTYQNWQVYTSEVVQRSDRLMKYFLFVVKGKLLSLFNGSMNNELSKSSILRK